MNSGSSMLHNKSNIYPKAYTSEASVNGKSMSEGGGREEGIGGRQRGGREEEGGIFTRRHIHQTLQ